MAKVPFTTDQRNQRISVTRSHNQHILYQHALFDAGHMYPRQEAMVFWVFHQASAIWCHWLD